MLVSGYVTVIFDCDFNFIRVLCFFFRAGSYVCLELWKGQCPTALEEYKLEPGYIRIGLGF